MADKISAPARLEVLAALRRRYHGAPKNEKTRVLDEFALSNLIACLRWHPASASAFINETLVAYCADADIEFTRSRPYQKNDQAWIEQKNGAVIRRFVGYERYSGSVAGQALAWLYSLLRLYVNYTSSPRSSCSRSAATAEEPSSATTSPRLRVTAC